MEKGARRAGGGAGSICNRTLTSLFEDDNMKNTEAELIALGVKAKGYASNAANFEDTDRVVNQIVEDFGAVDALVNNAGITKDGLLMERANNNSEKRVFDCLEYTN